MKVPQFALSMERNVSAVSLQSLVSSGVTAKARKENAEEVKESSEAFVFEIRVPE